jgi:hypothetical protein
MIMRGIERAALRAARALAAFGLLLLLAFAATQLADGLMRWVAGAPIVAVRDLGGLVAAIAVACCFPIALLEQSNISIRFIGSLCGELAGYVFEALAGALATVTISLIAWELVLYAGKAAKSGDTTWMLGIPVAPFWYLVAAIFWCAAAVQLIVFVGQIDHCVKHMNGDP